LGGQRGNANPSSRCRAVGGVERGEESALRSSQLGETEAERAVRGLAPVRTVRDLVRFKESDSDSRLVDQAFLAVRFTPCLVDGAAVESAVGRVLERTSDECISGPEGRLSSAWTAVEKESDDLGVMLLRGFTESPVRSVLRGEPGVGTPFEQRSDGG
jgi:hypothetical protein